MTEVDGEPDAAPVKTRSRASLILLVGSTFGVQGLSVITGVIAARLLGVEGRGTLALAFALGLIAAQLSFGGSLPVAVAKCLAERQITARDGLGAIIRRRSALLLIPCLAAGGGMIFIQRADPGAQKYAIAAVVVVATFQTIAFQVMIGSLQGEVGHLGRMAGVSMVPQLLFTIALVTASVAGWGWSALDMMFSFIAASTVGLFAGYRSLAKPTRLAENQLDEAILWKETKKTYVSSVRPIDGVGLDRVLVGALLGISPLGLYSAAVAVANMCSMIGSAVSVIVLPEIAQTNQDRAAQGAVIRRWVWLTALTVAAMVAALQLVVGPVIRIAFGQDFVGAIECARWLILADGLLGFRRVLISILQGQGRGGEASWIELALTPIMIIGVVIAAQHHSLVGIGVAIAVTGVLSCATLGLTVARRRSREDAPGAMAPRPGAHRAER